VSLLDYARDEYSQSGDDGIIDRIFSVISDRPGLCCEFGAWDGIHLSNTRALVLRGWRGVMIEADPEKFAELQRNYAEDPKVICLRSMIDDGPNQLDDVLDGAGVTDRLDFLSIDIDGLDYYVLGSLTSRPLCISVEVNGGHRPDTTELVPREVAAKNVGQPLGAFVRLAGERGYRLIGYSGNAFLLHEDAGAEEDLPTVDPVEAYVDCIGRLSQGEREWLHRANLGLEQSPHRFRNPYLSRRSLGIPAARAGRQLISATGRRIRRAL
jgi:nitrogen regulatory protein PII-like uncharacterized protein